jgi:putative addiction module component (TIGR02574 family)
MVGWGYIFFYLCIMAPQLKEILKLSLPERILWAEALWSSIAIDEKAIAAYQLSDEQIHILEEELTAYKANPEAGFTWEEAKKKIRKG